MKVLVIEDDRTIIDAIKVAFEFRWPDAALSAATTGEKGVKLVKSEPFDIVLLDLNLPDINGFEVLKRIREFSSIPVIILTVRADDQDMLRGLENGADDYIIKPFNYMTLLARVRAVLRRTESVPYKGSHNMSVNSRIKIDYVNQKVKIDNRLVKLTPSEYKLLAVLAKNSDTLVPYDRIVKEVWDKDYTGDTENIRIYVRRLRNLLKDNPPNLIINKRRQGYMLKS